MTDLSDKVGPRQNPRQWQHRPCHRCCCYCCCCCCCRWLVWRRCSGLLQVPGGRDQPHLGWGPASLWACRRLPGRASVRAVSIYFVDDSQRVIIKFYLFFNSRQIEFLSELAVLEGSFTGIGFWYLGLTDLGRFCQSAGPRSQTSYTNFSSRVIISLMSWRYEGKGRL